MIHSFSKLSNVSFPYACVSPISNLESACSGVNILISIPEFSKTDEIYS